MAVRGTASHAGRCPKSPVHKIWGSRRSGRLGEPPGASEGLDDAPHRLRPPSCPADRPGDLYGSIIRTFGIMPRGTGGRSASEKSGRAIQLETAK